MMPDGTIRIIDRKKDLVKVQVENICVVADSSKNYCVALIVPGDDYLNSLAVELKMENMTREELCEDPSVVATYAKVLAKHGMDQRLKRFEIPTAVFLVSEPWTPESGLLTAAMKLKRKSLETAFSAQILDLYAGKDSHVGSKKNRSVVV